jgi:hypothetical protein
MEIFFKKVLEYILAWMAHKAWKVIELERRISKKKKYIKEAAEEHNKVVTYVRNHKGMSDEEKDAHIVESARRYLNR